MELKSGPREDEDLDMQELEGILDSDGNSIHQGNSPVKEYKSPSRNEKRSV
jgi:hypothetical protein